MKIILFGATGNLGKAIAIELKKQGYRITAVVRNRNKSNELESIADEIITADVTNPSDLISVCNGYDIIISSLGKSISPNDKSKPTFYDIDYLGNFNILNEAIKSRIKKFVYVSAFHSEKYLHLEYFKVHQEFSEKLISSGLDYSIIKPPAIFSAFIDMIKMAKKGQLVNIGLGDKKTNPIYEGDLAKICISSFSEQKSIIEAGGKSIYTRKQLNEIVQNAINPSKSIKNIPLVIFKWLLPIIKIFDKNTFDKFAFFIEVIQHDTIAPLLGSMTFEEYIRMRK